MKKWEIIDEYTVIECTCPVCGGYMSMQKSSTCYYCGKCGAQLKLPEGENDEAD